MLSCRGREVGDAHGLRLVQAEHQRQERPSASEKTGDRVLIEWLKQDGRHQFREGHGVPQVRRHGA